MQARHWRRRLALGWLILWLPLAASAVTLKIATLAPEGTSWMKEMRAAGKEIERRTDGRVKLRFYPGGVMGGDEAVLKKMRFGQLHGGALSGLGLAAAHPDAVIYSLPFWFRDRAEVRHVRAELDEELRQRLSTKGYVMAGISDGGFVYLMSNRQVTDMQALRSVKLWSPEGDNLTREVYREFDVSPVVLPTSDIYTGLQTGLIDTVTSTNIGAVAFQWFTKLKYITDAPLGYIYGALIFDAKRVARLKPADRETLLSVTQAAFDRLSDMAWQGEAKARKALVDQGLAVVSAKPAEVSRLRELSARAVQRLSDQGRIDPQLLQKLVSILERYRAN